jgi:hypothetical protein
VGQALGRQRRLGLLCQLLARRVLVRQRLLQPLQVVAAAARAAAMAARIGCTSVKRESATIRNSASAVKKISLVSAE